MDEESLLIIRDDGIQPPISSCIKYTIGSIAFVYLVIYTLKLYLKN